MAMVGVWIFRLPAVNLPVRPKLVSLGEKHKQALSYLKRLFTLTNKARSAVVLQLVMRAVDKRMTKASG